MSAASLLAAQTTLFEDLNPSDTAHCTPTGMRAEIIRDPTPASAAAAATVHVVLPTVQLITIPF